MRRFAITTSVIVAALTLAGCGGVSKGYDSMDGAPAAMNSMAVADEYYTGGDYSSTYIDGDKADYSYTFTAGGETDKSKAEMLKDYELIQSLVQDKGGYIESVYNDYRYFEAEDLKYNDFARQYRAKGVLQFTIQIKNDHVPDITDKLEQLCQANRFTVIEYTQRIQNYRSIKVVDDYDLADPNRTITKEDLDRRLEYADISVSMTYKIPRGWLVWKCNNISAAFSGFWDSVGDIIQVVLALAFALFILFGEAVIFYKLFVKMIYKHKQKHPNYYPPKGVYVISDKHNER